MKSKPLVSVIITTKNEEKNIEACLRSIKSQSYKYVQMIVVDNRSTDKTVQISKRFTPFVFEKGPERSAQRNYGASKARGNYLLFLDADMILTNEVIAESVHIAESTPRVGGIIIPEESFGIGFWASAKALERSFYIGNEYIEAARFFRKDVFEKLGGFDTSLTGPEDWDFSQRVKNSYRLKRCTNFILHNEGKLSLWKSVRKKYYYSKKFVPYISKQSNSLYVRNQFSIIQRYLLFLSKPAKLFQNPLLGFGVLVMKTAEFTAGALGYLLKSR